MNVTVSEDHFCVLASPDGHLFDFIGVVTIDGRESVQEVFIDSRQYALFLAGIGRHLTDVEYIAAHRAHFAELVRARAIALMN